MTEQRYQRELNKPPGFWKTRQIPGKALKLAAAGKTDLVEQLLREKPEWLNHSGSHNRTLLFEATRMNRLETVRCLLQAGADANIGGAYNSETRVQIHCANAAMHYRRKNIAPLFTRRTRWDIFQACFSDRRQRIDTLLRKDPDLVLAEDPADIIYHTPALAFAVAGGHPDLCDHLCRAGARIAPYSSQLLHLAANRCELPLLTRLVDLGAEAATVDASTALVADLPCLGFLIQQGMPLNAVGDSGYPALVYLSRTDKGDNVERIRLLLQSGANPDVTGPGGTTALHWLCKAGVVAGVTELLAFGANPAVTNDDGATAIDLAHPRYRQALASALRGT